MGRSHDAETACAAAGDGETPEPFRRAQALVAEGRWREALAACEGVLRGAPRSPGGLELLGDIQCRLETWAQAARSYLAAIALAPHEARLFLKLGDLQRRCWDESGALESYRRAVELERAAARREHGAGARLAAGAECPAAYLELMKDCLTFLLWEASDGSLLELHPRRPAVSLARVLQRIGLWRRAPDVRVRELGMDWPARALTMVGRRRLDNLQECVERALADGIPGDLLEAGVWRGGATIFMRALLRAYGSTQRKVWVVDSFRGLPRPDARRYPADRGFDLSIWRSLAVPVEEVRQNFRRFGLLDEQVVFLAGWFAETLPVAPIERLAVLRLDADLYESTADCLAHLYAKVSRGGFIIVDDYYSARPCRQAVDDFRRRHALREAIVRIDGSGAFWRKA